MKLLQKTPNQASTRIVDHRCNHPHAVVIDPTERQLRELEAMLASCPNCSRWAPGDGPIMATLPSRKNPNEYDSKDIS